MQLVDLLSAVAAEAQQPSAGDRCNSLSLVSRRLCGSTKKIVAAAAEDFHQTLAKIDEADGGTEHSDTGSTQLVSARVGLVVPNCDQSELERTLMEKTSGVSMSLDPTPMDIKRTRYSSSAFDRSR